ncbi:protein of unknown function [Magnetospirillum sp. XM-1]|nr:protein of unknown function [Magnetospirillum sp. XM-1]
MPSAATGADRKPVRQSRPDDRDRARPCHDYLGSMPCVILVVSKQNPPHPREGIPPGPCAPRSA